MSRISENEKEFKRASYWRLLGYAKPYWKRLAIGIICGILVGGSLFSVFMILPQMLNLVDMEATGSPKVHAAADKIVRELNSKPGMSEAEQLQAVESVLNPADNDRELTKTLTTLKDFSEKCSLPLDVQTEKRLITVTWPGTWTFHAVNPESGHLSWQFFAIYMIGFIVIWLIKATASYINHFCTRWVGARVVMDLRNELYTALINQSMSFYGKQDVGHLISKCTNDTQSIELSVSDAISEITRCPLEILACACAIVYAAMQNETPVMVVFLVAGLCLCILPLVILARKVRKIYRKAQSRVAELTSRMHETFTGIPIIKANNTEKRESERFETENRKYFKIQIRALRLHLLFSPLMEVVGIFAITVFLLYAYGNGITMTQMVMLIAPALVAYRPLKDMARVINHIQRSMASADRFFDMVDQKVEMKEAENPVTMKSFDNDIEFQDVRFAYEPGHWILDGMDLTISKGQMVAVVGETGSGKTTIASLIARFYDPNEGRVLVDGVQVKDYTIESLRKHIGIVTQDPILFNDTIANNIAYGRPEATREEIETAAKQANAHEFIVSGTHPLGYDEEVGEKGCKLSGGEKQRIAIARAILKNPPILILDEATSALDTVTEKLVQEALNKVMTNRTVFAIAHRLSTIQNADKIIVLHKGKIVEAGNHAELLALNGRYKKLHDTQFARDTAEASRQA